MAREDWYADGWHLTEGTVRDVEYRSGLAQVAPVQGENPRIPGRTGSVWRRKAHDEGRFVLNVWTADDAPREDVDALWDNLVRVLCQPHRLVRFRRVMADGSARICDGEVVTQVEPQPLGQAGYRAGFEVRVPSGYWESEVVHSVTGSGTFDLTDFADSTAPLDRLIYRCYGPFSTVTVSDAGAQGTGDSFTYAEAVGGGYVRVNAGTWEVAGFGGHTVQAYAISNTGPRFLTLAPGLPGQAPRVTVSAGTLEVEGRSAYLC